MWRNDLAYLFPIRTQTPEKDRYRLAQLFDYVRSQNPQYRYLEVGSFLGGSLAPALRDERCAHILSIDLRPVTSPDARQKSYHYGEFSTGKMLETLKEHGFSDLSKLRTFDGRASDYDFAEEKFHLAFIDAEHTDEAVFEDFLSIYDHLEPRGVCIFHDTNLLTTGVENILAFLRYQGREHGFVVFQESWVSAIFLDQTLDQLPPGVRADRWEWQDFKDKSRDGLLLKALRNRCEVKFTLKPRKTPSP